MDPYVYPETNVLRNLRDIRDAGRLSRFEATATIRRTVELEHEPIPGRFDARHLQAIHRYIFQDVYKWAGDFRSVNISQSGDFAFRQYAFHQYIVSSLDNICGELKREGHLAGSDPEHFAIRGPYYLGEINAIHPFREGNGRTQREFVRELAIRNGLTIDWSQVSREEMIEASRRSLRVDNAGLAQVLRKGLDNESNRQPALESGQGGTKIGR